MPDPADLLVATSGTVGKGHKAPKHEPQAREGLHARLRAIHNLTPRQVLRSPLLLPVMIGEELSVEEEYLWEDFGTVGDGEHSSPAPGKSARPQQKFTGETLSLTWDARWLANPGVNPEKLRRELLRIGRERALFDLLILNKPGADFAEFSGYANIRRITRGLKRGESDTRYYTIDFAEYRPMTVGRKKHRFGPRLPSTHALTKTDTLRSLARELLGNEEKWRMIARANGITKWGGNDPLVDSKRFKVGDRIKIPYDLVSGGTTAPDGSEPAVSVAEEVTS